MAYDSGFRPTYDGFIRFSTGSFAPSASVGAMDVQDKIFHNLEWLYGTSTQVRANWVSRNGIVYGREGATLQPNQPALLFSQGPFPLNQTNDGKPLPLYVRVEAGISHKVGEAASGSVTVHLRQGDLLGQRFNVSEIGTFMVTGESGSHGTYELTTPSSSLSTSSSLLEIQAHDIRYVTKLPIRSTASLTQTDGNVSTLLCWLDFWGMPTGDIQINQIPTYGFRFFGVYAAEFCPKLSDD